MEHYILNGRRSVWPHLQHIKHNTRIERTLTDAISKIRRMSYYSALGHSHSVGSPTRPVNVNVNGASSLQHALLSGNGPPSPLMHLSLGNGGTPRPGNGMLPPLAPSSNASSRCSTPQRHRNDMTPLPHLASALRRSDSGRFDDDDADMFESAATTPSSSTRAAAAIDLPPGDGGSLPLLDSTHYQRLGRSPGIHKSKLRQLQAENQALRERVALLQMTMEKLLKHTELGPFQLKHTELGPFQLNETSMSGLSDYPTNSNGNEYTAHGSSTLAPSSSPVLYTSDTDDEVEVPRGRAMVASGISP